MGMGRMACMRSAAGFAVSAQLQRLTSQSH